MKITYQLDDYVPKGSCLQGHITTTYDRLVETFGEPNKGPSDKVWTEWSIRFTTYDEEMNEEDDHYVTIYDWKEVDEYDSHVGEYRWHIGGKQMEALWCVMDALNSPETMTTVSYTHLTLPTTPYV